MIFDYAKDTGVTNSFQKPEITFDYDVKQFEKVRQIMIDTGLSIEDVAKKMNTELHPAIVNYAKTTAPLEQTQEGLNNSIKNTSISFATMAAKSKLAAVGVGLLNAFSGMAISALAGLAVTGVIQLFDAIIETPKEIAEAAQEAKNKIDELVGSLAAARQLVDGSGTRFAELSQGVNQFTGENKSLPMAEYEEFLSLNSQLAEMFPQLSRTYTTNGDAIVQLSGNVDTIVGSLEGLIVTQKELANTELLDNLPKVFKGYQTNLEDYSKKIKSYESDIIGIEEQLYAAINGERTYSTYDNASNDYAGLLANLGIDYEVSLNKDDTGTFDETLTYILPSDDAMQGIVNETINEYKDKISTIQQKIEEENAGIQKYFFAFLSGDWEYSNLSTDMQMMAQKVVGSIDWSTAMHNGELVDSWKDAEAYIRETILNGLSGLSTETQAAFSELFALDLSTVPIGQLIDDYNLLIEQAIQELGLNEEEAIEYRIKFSYVFENEQDSLAKAKNKMGVVLEGTEKDEWLRTLDEADLKLLVTLDIDETTALEEAQRLLDEAREQLPKYSLVDMNPAIESLDREQDAYKTLSAAIDEYNVNQTLSLDTAQALLSLDSKYLQTLVDENGQLQLNAEAFHQLTLAKIADLEVTAVNNMMARVEALKSEAGAIDAIKESTLNLTSARWEDARAAVQQKKQELLAEPGNNIGNRMAVLNQYEEAIDVEEAAFNAMKNGLATNPNKFYGYDPNAGSGGEDKKFEEEFDWIANSVDNVTRALDILKEKLANATLNEKIPIFEELKTASQEVVDTTKLAAEAYASEWEEKASKISVKHRNSIMSSENFDIEPFDDEDEYNAVMEAKEAYDAKNSSAQEYTDALTEQAQILKDETANHLAIEQIKLEELSYIDQTNMTVTERNKILKQEEGILYNILQDNLALANSAEEKVNLEKEYKQALADSSEEAKENARNAREDRIGYYDSRIKDMYNNIELLELTDGQDPAISKQYDDAVAKRKKKYKGSKYAGNVDLYNRPTLLTDDGYETLRSETYNYSDFGIDKKGAFNVTPILPDGTKIENLNEYILEQLQDGKTIDELDIFMGAYSSIDKAVVAADKLHKEQDKIYSSEVEYLKLLSNDGTEESYAAIDVYLEKQKTEAQAKYEEALALRKEATWNTPEWKKQNDIIQESQELIHASTVEQIENNRAVLQLPVKKYEEANKLLEEKLALQEKEQEKIESAIGYANMLVQDEIDALNEDKEAVTKRYENQIKAIQEQKDALTDSNDELQRQIDLENAKFNLEKAMRNKTQRIYRAGEGFVYEADQDAIRDAQAELDQQQFDNTIADFDSQIDALNKAKESEIEVIDAEIKTWEDYAKKLDAVTDSYDRLISKRNFLELFGGAGGEAAVLNKDMGILTNFESTLNNAKLEVDTIQAQIDANNLTISKIKEEAESYLGTTKQLKEAQDAINQAIVDNEAELLAIQARSEKTKELGGTWTAADLEIESALDLIGTAQVEGKDAEVTVLGERKTALEQFRDAAVLLYKEIATEVSKANLAFTTMETTLTKAQQTYKEILALANGSEGIETTITYTFPDYRTFHSGGIVGQEIPKNKLPENLMALTDANLKPNETLAKLLNGEVVLNNTQMGSMFDNLGRAYSAITPLNKRESSPLEITIGDVNVYNPENTDMIVNEIVKELPLKVVQRLHSK